MRCFCVLRRCVLSLLLSVDLRTRCDEHGTVQWCPSTFLAQTARESYANSFRTTFAPASMNERVICTTLETIGMPMKTLKNFNVPCMAHCLLCTSDGFLTVVNTLAFRSIITHSALQARRTAEGEPCTRDTRSQRFVDRGGFLAEGTEEVRDGMILT